MFYYYEKDGKILASDRDSLPYPKGEPAPGAPIFYLVEGDPALGRGSFKVTHPGQLKSPHGLEVLDASRLPDFPLDGPLSAALEDLLGTEGNQHRSALCGQGTQSVDLSWSKRQRRMQTVHLLPPQSGQLTQIFPRNGFQGYAGAVP